MRIDVRKKGPIEILDLAGKLTIGEGDILLREKFGELLESGERLFILNFTKVPYLDSSGIGETLHCDKRARERDGVVKLVLTGKTREIFTIQGLDKALEMFADEAAALASFDH